MTVVPSYFDAFHCIADRCRHSCCVGWEIDVDREAADRYRAVSGAFGERLAAALHDTEDGCAFRLGDDERCPFLNANGLCDIILTLGEDALCDICALHPRFRYDYSDRTEWGLGLCCEAAADLILRHPDKVTLCGDSGEMPPDPEEAALLGFRQRMIDVAQDRTLSIAEREERLLSASGLSVPSDRTTLLAWYTPLERLDTAWDDALRALTDDRVAPLSIPDTAFEQLLVYFLYRHLPPSLDDGRLSERLAFCVLSARMIRTLAKAIGGELAAFAELSRLYSSEIEYSDENVDELLDRLARYAAS